MSRVQVQHQPDSAPAGRPQAGPGGPEQAQSREAGGRLHLGQSHLRGLPHRSEHLTLRDSSQRLYSGLLVSPFFLVIIITELLYSYAVGIDERAVPFEATPS